MARPTAPKKSARRSSKSRPVAPKRPGGGRRLLAVPVGGGTPEPALLPASAFRTDSWVNAATGLGGFTTDRAAASRYELEPIPTTLLIDALYTSDWLAARLVEKMPSIALVRGFGIEGADDPTEVLRAFERLNTTERYPEGAFQRAMFDGRAYGAAGLFLGYELGDPLSELDPAGSGALAFLDVFRQDELKVLTRVKNPKRSDFGMPELYEVIGTSGSGVMHPRRGQKFHASRLLRFTGKPLRTANHELGAFPEVGVSVLAPVIRDISRYGMSWAAVSHLLQDASVGVMKLAGLVEGLASEDDSVILDRLKTLQATKGITRMMFLDADAGEEYGRVAVSFADIPGVMAQIILSISGAADMPAKILFGTSPMGLNANSAGEADLTQFYNSVDEYRRRVIGPKLEAVLRAVTGKGDVKIAWPSLWEPTENEKAQTRLTNANATRAYWDMGAVQAKDIVKAAKTGLQPETIGTPSDERKPDPDGEGPGGGGAGPQGGPGARLAAALASEGRRRNPTDDPDHVYVRDAVGPEGVAQKVDTPEKARVQLERTRSRLEKRLLKYERQLGKQQDLAQEAQGLRERVESLESAYVEADERFEDLKDAGAQASEIQAAKDARKEARRAMRDAEREASRAEANADRFLADTHLLDEGLAEHNAALQAVKDVTIEEWARAAEAHKSDPTPENEARLTSAVANYRRASDEFATQHVPEYDDFGAVSRLLRGEDDTPEAEIKARKEAATKAIQQGPRGGRFYTSESGARVYVRE